MVLSLIAGLALALLRLSRVKPISVAAGAWVDVWRNLPLIFILLYLSLTIPGAWPNAYEDAIPSWFPEGLQSGPCWRPSSASCSTTRPCWPRSCAPASSRSTAARTRRPARSA